MPSNLILDGNYAGEIKHIPVVGEMFYCRKDIDLGLYLILDVKKNSDSSYEVTHFNLKTKRRITGWQLRINENMTVKYAIYCFLP